MPSYQEATDSSAGMWADFRVSYCLVTAEEGGRWAPPYQHIRWNFRYDDGAISTGTFMIFPEILTPDGGYFPEGQPILMAGLADMFVLGAESRAFHAQHIRPGTRGYFMEGGQRVGVCEVLEVTGLRAQLAI